MVLPGHIAGGYLATTALLAITHTSFSPLQTGVLLTTGILAAEAPDIDLFWFYLAHRYSRGKKPQSHRDYLTHAPIIWLALSLVIVIIGFIASSQFTSLIGWAILTGSWSHFLLDSIEYGVMWLWPFSRERFAVRHIPEAPEEEINQRAGSIPYYFEFIYKTYIRNVTFYAEIAVVILAIYVAIH